MRCGVGLCFLAAVWVCAAHVTLDYPPPISRLDFLDNVRTTALCGMSASGADGSHAWRIPESPNDDVVTDLEAGSLVNVTWNLHYPHQGGWRVQMYNDVGEEVATWEDGAHWGCSYDGTQQWAELRMPPTRCENCILRFERQALEWGANYRFRSCAKIRVLLESPCNGCSGNGVCKEGKCECYKDTARGFWEGTYCERQNECDLDVHCGDGGVCLDTRATTPPRKQCYCKKGWFGAESQPWLPESLLPVRICDRRSDLAIDDVDEWEQLYTHKRRSSPEGDYELFYKIDEAVVEVAIKAKSKGWVGFGLRPVSTTSANVVASSSDSESEGEAEGEGESEAEGEGEGEGEGGDGQSACPPGADGALRDEGAFSGASGEPSASSTRRLEQLSLPPLQTEAQLRYAAPQIPAWTFEGRSLKQAAESVSESEAEVVSEGEGEATSHAHSGSITQPAFLPEASESVVEGPCTTLLTTDPTAHPMINQDVVVGLAHGNAFRIQDAYTPSRARPLADVYFGGRDDVLDAVAYEDETYTYLKFRRLLETTDSATDYCILDSLNYLMIYAFGQSPESFSHTPWSSLEASKAGRRDFYGVDEFKFHGGGIGTSYEGRGTFGVVNFFESESATGCAASTLPGYACMAEAIPSVYTLHWSVDRDRVRLAAEARVGGWVGLAWPEIPGQMIGATAVIGSEASLPAVYALTFKSATGVVPDENAFQIMDASFAQADGATLMEFSRSFDRVFEDADALDLLVAAGNDDALTYHGLLRSPIQLTSVSRDSGQQFNDRRPTERRPSQELSPGCAPSELPDMDCVTDVLSGTMLHWRVESTGVSFALQAPGSGWASVAWPDNPGSMVPSTAVIGSSEIDVGVYRLDGRTSDRVVPAPSLFTLPTSSLSTANGQTILRFTRVFDALFDGEGDIPLLAAFHPDNSDLSYHGLSTRAALTVNFQTGSTSVGDVEDKSRFLDAHAVLMTVSWGMLLPFGVLVARTLKDKDPFWFNAHKSIQTIGLAAALAGFVIALIKFETDEDFRHRQVGLVVMAMGLAQPLNAIIRPRHGAFLRTPWEWLHLSVGRCALILGIYNIYTGLDRYADLRQVGSKKWHFRYGMWLIAFVLLALVLEARAQGLRSSEERKRKAAAAEAGPSPLSTRGSV